MQDVLSGECSLGEAQGEYRSLIERHVVPCRYLLAAQKVLPALPMGGIKAVGDFVRQPW